MVSCKVTLGQLAFVVIVLMSGWLIHRIKVFPLRPTELTATYVIGSVAAYCPIDAVGNNKC